MNSQHSRPAFTSPMTSVTFALPMARRRLLRIAQAFASFQSCRMCRSTHTSPSSPGGMVSARHSVLIKCQQWLMAHKLLWTE